MRHPVRHPIALRSAFFAAVFLISCGPAPEEADQEWMAEEEQAFPGSRGLVRFVTVEVDPGHIEELVAEEIDGALIYEGDIILPNVPQDAASRSAQGLASIPRSRIWSNGVIPYVIDRNLPNAQRVLDAIAHWEAKTQLRFVRRSSHRSYVHFRPSSGCSSSIGRIGGRQYINLSRSCTTGNVVHEIGHAIGLWHEQSRPDREPHINVNWSNITAGYEHNFHTWKQRRQSGSTWGSYDLGSIMHYGSYFFSRTGRPTLVKQNGATIYANRRALSRADIAGVQRLYADEF